MDKFVNLAKQGYEAYESHSNVSKTGGQELNTTNPPSGAGPTYDDDEVVRTAEKHGSGDKSLFSTALSFLNDNKSDHEKPIDEQDAQDAHKKAYQEDSPGSLPAKSIGSAAALEVLKKFTSGSSGSSGKDSKTDLISMAMAEASKLFDKSGGAASGNKQDAVNGAAMTVMKLFVQSKTSGTTGGSDSVGLGQLMSLASKFTK